MPSDDSAENREEPETGSGSGSPDESVVDRVLDGEQQTVFKNKQLVDPGTIVDHDRIYGRDEQLAAEARAFRDTLNGDRPPDLFLYGSSGTGKTLTVRSVAENVKRRAMQNDLRFDYVSVNFRTMESYTLDQAVWKLGYQTANKAGVVWDIPQNGISTDEKYLRLYEIVDEHFDALVFILDEIDALTSRNREGEPAYSRLLYSLSRIMDEEIVDTLTSTVIITNRPKFEEELDSRADSSYNPKDILFSDYDASELTEILERRRDAFKEDALEEKDGVIKLVAAYGAKNEGDARRAIDLLRDAGELANDWGDSVVRPKHVRAANDSVIKNRVLNLVEGMSFGKKLSLYAAAIVADVNDGDAPSPVVYQVYQECCEQGGWDMYTQETVNKHINKAKTYDIIESDRTSGGFKSGVYLLFKFIEPLGPVLETLNTGDSINVLDEEELRSTARQALYDSS